VLAAGVPPQCPVDGLTLSDITGDCGRALTLVNMRKVALNAIGVTGYQGNFLTATNVQGTGFVEPKVN
jgi:hypothetical protein